MQWLAGVVAALALGGVVVAISADPAPAPAATPVPPAGIAAHEQRGHQPGQAGARGDGHAREHRP